MSVHVFVTVVIRHNGETCH